VGGSDMDNIIPVLLIEDDKKECDLYKECFIQRDDVKLIAITNSSDEAIDYVKTHAPEGVILDIDLNEGIGSGYKFLEDLHNLKIDNKPVIVVITQIDSKLACKNIYGCGVPMIFSKHKKDYSPVEVINTLVGLVNTARQIRTNHNSYIENTDTEAMKSERIKNKILRELEIVGFSDNLLGKQYIFDAIYHLIENNLQDIEGTVMQFLMKKHSKTRSNLLRIMQVAIQNAWRKSPIETLVKHYTQVVNYNTGIPTVNELIYYYAHKVYKHFEYFSRY